MQGDDGNVDWNAPVALLNAGETFQVQVAASPAWAMSLTTRQTGQHLPANRDDFLMEEGTPLAPEPVPLGYRVVSLPREVSFARPLRHPRQFFVRRERM